MTAFYEESLDRVVFTSDTTGSEAIEWEDVEGTFLADTLNLSGVTQTAGNDALFTINSTDSADEITKTSNEFTINGLQITLKQATVANDSYSDTDTTSVRVSSAKDESALKAKINAFLTSYNNVIDYIRAKQKVDVTTYTRGALAGDTAASYLRTSINGFMLNQVTGLDEDKPSYLSDIGITLDSSLHASISDADALSDWLDEDPAAVENLFNSENGVAATLETFLEDYTETYGIMDGRTEAIDDKIENIDSRISVLEKRMQLKEAMYRKQFASLQELLTNMNYQQSIMNNLMQSLNNQFG